MLTWTVRPWPALIALASTVACAQSAPPLDLLPGEFEPVEWVLVSWDTTRDAYFVDIARSVAGHAKLGVALGTEAERNHVADLLELHEVPLADVAFIDSDNSMWMRDYGPLVVRGFDGTRTVVDLTYAGREDDDVVPHLVADELLDLPVVHLPLVLEGGNLLSDGAGRCVTTDFALEPNRVLGGRAELHTALRSAFGCTTLVVMPALDGEPTGHVDMFATIVGPARIVVGRYDPALDPENAARLDTAAALAAAHGFAVERIPMPTNHDGVFRSYANSLAVNDVVLMPAYADDTEHEADALAVLERAYPDRFVIPVQADSVLELDGAVHCTIMTVAAP